MKNIGGILQKYWNICIKIPLHAWYFNTNIMYLWVNTLVNPRRACAARVTVLGLSFCLSVCLSVRHAILAVRATKSITKDTTVLSVRFAAILKRRFS